MDDKNHSQRIGSKVNLNNSCRVLLIEDDISLNSILYKYLKHENYQIVSLNTNKIDIQKIDKKQFDIIIIDSDISGSNIYNLIKELKLSFINKPLIVISAISQEHQLYKNLANNGDTFLSKPINLNQITEKIQYYISDRFARV